MDHVLGPRILEAKEDYHRYTKLMRDLEREASKDPVDRNTAAK